MVLSIANQIAFCPQENKRTKKWHHGYETSVDENSEPVEGDLDAHGTWDIGE